MTSFEVVKFYLHFAQSVWEIASALAEKVGQNEVDGFRHKVSCT